MGPSDRASGGHREQTVEPRDSDDPESPETRPLGTVAFAPLLVEGEQAGSIERNRTVREDRERAERARERRTGWEQDWIDWEGDGPPPR